MMIRFYWNYYSEIVRPGADEHRCDLDIDGLTTETVIKEMIALGEGNRSLGQYMTIRRMERIRD